MEDHKTTALTRRAATTTIREIPAGGSPPIARIDHTGLIRVELEIDRFCEDLTRAGRVRPSTIQTYHKRLRFFLAWLTTLPQDPPWAWSLELMYAYRAHLEQTLRSPRAMNGYVVALRQFGISLKTLYQRPMDPAEFVKGWKTIRSPQRRPLPVADAKKLLTQLATDSRHTMLQRLRNEALAYLMLKTGLREIEVSRATIGDLQPGEPGKYWRLYVHGKGHLMADEWVKVLPEVHDKITAYLACRGGAQPPSAPLFVTTAPAKADGTARASAGRPLGTRSIQRIITEGLLLAEAKHPGIVVHSLRHSAATYATLNGAPPSQVQRMMRHKHYGTTEHYVREAQQMMEGAEGKITQI
jgi:integrase/recombinase XerC/integrase/recombinase XerD